MTTIVLAVALAGGLGALVRNEVTARCARALRAGRAIGTSAVNLSGAFLLALLVGLGEAGRVDEATVLVAGLGFAGSLTTFSTWLVEAVRARIDGDRGLPVVAGVEVAGQLLVGVVIAALVLWAVA